jgi:signal transduction histidine kinase/CheY-like chemotaxis protein/HPt (histidine-containing phosphotransfer) domain-containing protein
MKDQSNGFLARISRLGVTDDFDPRAAKRVILSNQTAACIGLLALLAGLACLFIGLPQAVSFCFLAAAGYAAVPLLSKAGRLSFSRLYHVIFTNLVVMAICWYFGRGSGFYFHFLSPVLVSLLVMGTHEKKYLVFSFSVTAACLTLLVALGLLGFERHPLPPRAAAVVFFINLIVAMVLNGFRIYSFFLRTMETEKALAEAVETARRTDKAKNRFLANMSHEIRTPLNGILGLSDVMSRSDLTGSHRENIESIRSSAFDLLAIINEILDVSKIEAGKMRLEYTAFELSRLVESLRRVYFTLANRKNLRFAMESSANIPKLLVGDPVRLKQVLNNLIGNAFKFTENGQVSLRLRMGRLSENILPMEFEVEDTGVGIPQEAQDRLFHPFSQAEETTARRYGGTGLGLYLCRQMVEMMGGTIGFESRAGRGSRFFFTVPLALAAEGARPGKTAPEEEAAGWAPSGKGLEGLRILLVEDHPVNRRVLEAMIETHGGRAVTAADGVEALNAYTRGEFDLILMDSHMPHMDGYECTRKIRQLTSRRPVIIGVTADAMQGSREKCLQAGMDDMITKPIMEKDLAAVMARWFGEGRAPAPSWVAEPSAAYAAEPAAEWVDAHQLGEMNTWIRQYHPGYWDKTLSLFEKSFQKLYQSIRDACEAGRFEEAGESAHALRGACVMLGMRRLADTCLSLEALGLGGKTAAWVDLLGNLAAEREPTLKELRRWIN